MSRLGLMVAGLTLLVSSWTLRVFKAASAANSSSASATLQDLRWAQLHAHG
jgi:hypothetical protein